MDEETKIRYRRLFEPCLTALKAESTTNTVARNVATLDQQSVGRLSRLDEDGFGYCETCGENIPEARLQLSLTATRCVSCIHS